MDNFPINKKTPERNVRQEVCEIMHPIQESIK
jgi:hypothetical protein